MFDRDLLPRSKDVVNFHADFHILFLPFVTDFVAMSKRVLTWDFISGKMKSFQFGVWLSLVIVYVKCLEMKLIAFVISLQLFWQKLNFITCDKSSVNTIPKWNLLKEKTVDRKINTKRI